MFRPSSLNTIFEVLVKIPWQRLDEDDEIEDDDDDSGEEAEDETDEYESPATPDVDSVEGEVTIHSCVYIQFHTTVIIIIMVVKNIQNLKVIPLKLFYYQTCFEAQHN